MSSFATFESFWDAVMSLAQGGDIYDRASARSAWERGESPAQYLSRSAAIVRGDFNALAPYSRMLTGVIGAPRVDTSRYIIPAAVPMVALGFGAGGAAVAGKWGTRGTLANAGVAALALLAGMYADLQDREATDDERAYPWADVKNALYGAATGLGTVAAALPVYDYVKGT